MAKFNGVLELCQKVYLVALSKWQNPLFTWVVAKKNLGDRFAYLGGCQRGVLASEIYLHTLHSGRCLLGSRKYTIPRPWVKLLVSEGVLGSP